MRNLKIKTKKSDITEKFRVKDKIIGCDGGEDYGHPLVYLNLTKDDLIEEVIQYSYSAAPGGFGGAGVAVPTSSARLKRGDKLDQLIKATKLPEQIIRDYLARGFVPEDYIISHFGPDNNSLTRPVAPAELRLAAWSEAGTVRAMPGRDNVRFKDIQDYAKTFYRNTSHVTSPDGSIIDKKLYMMVFIAPVIEFYDRYKEDFINMAENASL